MKQNLVVFVNPKLLKDDESLSVLRRYLLSEPSLEQFCRIEDIEDSHVFLMPNALFNDAHLNAPHSCVDPYYCIYDSRIIGDGYFKMTVQALMEFIG